MRASIAKDKQVACHSVEWASEHGRNKRDRAGLFPLRPLPADLTWLLFVGLVGFRLGLAPWFRFARGRLLRFAL
jgi:hypothetical protein